MMSRIKKAAKLLLYGDYNFPQQSQNIQVDEGNKIPDGLSSWEYWTAHNVTSHLKFGSREESLSFLRWRFDQYPNYENLMPCAGHDGKVILDYGCGPGHDVAGFVEYSNPRKVIAMDVSPSSLEETKVRVSLHGKAQNVEIKLIKEGEKLDIPDNSIDYIHSSGVLHHTPNMEEILNEFKRILKPEGIIRIMVYNYESVWSHLYVPFIIQIERKKNSELSHAEAFKQSTDGDKCPISRYYKPTDFLEICRQAGFNGKYLGAGVSLDELKWLADYKVRAMQDINLAEEHRCFLNELTYNEKLWPIYKGQIAGIDAVYELRK